MKRVLSVGNCMADHSALREVIEQAFSAQVDAADTLPHAMLALEERPYDLVLINRIFDANGASGMDMIREMKQHERTRAVPAILVSNFPAAQQEAAQLGAAPGFGKSQLNESTTLDALRSFLG